MTLVELLTIRGVRFRRSAHKTGELTLNCPMPNCGDNRFRLGLNYKKNVGQCFNCHWKAKRNAVQKVLRALSLQEMPLTDVRNEVEEAKPEEPKLPEDFTLLSEVEEDDDLLWTPVQYLLDRGITRKQIKKHYLGCSISGRFRYRIIIPVIFDEEFMGTVCRDWTGKREPKYLNSTGEKSIWNCPPAVKGNPPLILAEGCFKAMALESALKREAGALLGHDITDQMVEQLLKMKHKSVMLWPDPDAVGVEGAFKVAEKLLAAHISVEFPSRVPKKQADEMRPETRVKYASETTPFTWGFYQRTRNRMHIR